MTIFYWCISLWLVVIGFYFATNDKDLVSSSKFFFCSKWCYTCRFWTHMGKSCLCFFIDLRTERCFEVGWTPLSISCELLVFSGWSS